MADLRMDAHGGPRHLFQNMQQDCCEGVVADFTGGNAKYMWEQREKFAALFAEKRLDMMPQQQGGMPPGAM